VPVQHYAAALARGAGAEAVLQVYQRLLGEVRRFQRRQGGGDAYNVVMTREWMCLIPRRRGGRGAVGTNGIGMLGVGRLLSAYCLGRFWRTMRRVFSGTVPSPLLVVGKG